MSVVVLALVSALVGKRKLSAWTDKNRAYHFATHDHGSCDDTFETPHPAARARRARAPCGAPARQEPRGRRRAEPTVQHTPAHMTVRVRSSPASGRFGRTRARRTTRETARSARGVWAARWGPCLGAENLLTDERQSHGSPREVDTFPGTESRLPTPVPPRSRPRDAAGRATRCETKTGSRHSPSQESEQRPGHE